MPRKSTKTESDIQRPSSTRTGRLGTPVREEIDNSVRVESKAWTAKTKEFFADERTSIVAGLVLAFVAMFLLIAYVSFFFTGEADQSLLELTREQRREHRVDFQNVLGLPGAAIATGLIDGGFGVCAIFIIVFIAFLSAYLFHQRPISMLRASCYTVFGATWGAVLLGFVQSLVGTGTFNWGGRFGTWCSEWLRSYIQTTGTIIVLVASLLIFCVLADKHFLSRCKSLWLKMCAIRLRKAEEKQEEETGEIVSEIEETASSTEGDGEGDEIIEDENPEEDENTQDGEIEEKIEAGNGNVIDIEIEEVPAKNEQSDEVLFSIVRGGEGEGETGADDTPKEEDNLADTTLLPEVGGDETGEGEENTESSPSLAGEKIPETGTLATGEEGKGEEGGLIIEAGANVQMVKETAESILEKLGPYDPRKDLEYFKFPSLDLLKTYDNENVPQIDETEQRNNGARIVTTLKNYGIEIESIKATVGPTVTLYEIVPKAGVRISKIQALENDIMLSLAATGIRIIAPMPGKGTVGIEVPNVRPQIVSMHSVIASRPFQEEKKMRLPIAIGRTITNDVFCFDLAKTPHLLVAGATGQGKSVAINAILTSLLYKKHPAELKMVLVDPKMVEFAPYKPLLRHYLAAMPETDDNDVIITDCDKVINTLNSLVIEMENRYKLLMDAGVRNLEDYNEKFVNRRLNPEKVVADTLHHQFLPYIVIVIDEYGDFIMQAGKQVETPIARITQKARAVGMHMILATQRPSVNIVTGVIKANIPTRIALRTQSVIDSRTVLDTKGAEQLVGRGDMLYAANGNVIRIQCAFVDTPEVDAVVEHVQNQQRYFEPYQLPEYIPEGQEDTAGAAGSVDMKRLDPMFVDVARYVVSKQEGSTSRLQRAFEIGYNRAGKLSDQLEAAGIVGPNKGPKGRDVLITDFEQLDKILEDLGLNG